MSLSFPLSSVGRGTFRKLTSFLTDPVISFGGKTQFVITLYTDMGMLILFNLQTCIMFAGLQSLIMPMSGNYYIVYACIIFTTVIYTELYILHYVSTSHCLVICLLFAGLMHAIPWHMKYTLLTNKHLHDIVHFKNTVYIYRIYLKISLSLSGIAYL